jgi:hypothetical protein
MIKWLLIALLAANAIGCIAAIGRPRQPMTVAGAISVLIVNIGIVLCVLAYWR